MLRPVLQSIQRPSAATYSIFAPDLLLSEPHLRRTIDKFAKLKPIKSSTKAPTRSAAVLLPICLVNGQVSLLYTLRASDLKSHRGQVSFPGGIRDKTDKNLTATALRETQEELGIRPDDVHAFGEGDFTIMRDTTTVLPIVGVLRNRNLFKELAVNPSEVKEVFTVPIRTLADPRHRRHTQFRTNYSLPVFTGGKRKIWGLTAIITNSFLSCYVPEYEARLNFVPPVKKGAVPYHLL